MFRLFKKKKPQTKIFAGYYILLVLPDSVPVREGQIRVMEGIFLKKIEKKLWEKHQGIRYCLLSEKEENIFAMEFSPSFVNLVKSDIYSSVFRRKISKNNVYSAMLNDAVKLVCIDNRR